MKRSTLVIISLVFSLHFAFSQNKLTRYCEIETGGSTGRAGSKLRWVSISTGNLDSLSLFKSVNIQSNLEKVATLKSEADVLNYMDSLGWTLVQFNGLSNKYFLFKKNLRNRRLLVIRVSARYWWED